MSLYEKCSNYAYFNVLVNVIVCLYVFNMFKSQ